MKLIVISSSKTRENETRLVTELFENGLETFHLRKPAMRTREMRQFLDAIPAHFHNRIVIHSHHALASEYKLKGIHLTRIHLRQSLSTWFRRKILNMRNPGYTVSTTFHKIGAVYENKQAYDYVLLGTIFDPVSGKFNAGYSEHSLRAVIAKTDLKLIARGGTNADNIKICADLGMHGMAFSSAVWKQADPVEAFCGIISSCSALNIPVE
jgi:thiamine-phosphate pyrophosphorylase